MAWWALILDAAKAAAESPAVKLAVARRIIEKFKRKKKAEAEAK
jgi:hypothetical protein